MEANSEYRPVSDKHLLWMISDQSKRSVRPASPPTGSGSIAHSAPAPALTTHHLLQTARSSAVSESTSSLSPTFDQAQISAYMSSHFAVDQRKIEQWNNEYGKAYYYCLTVRLVTRVWSMVTPNASGERAQVSLSGTAGSTDRTLTLSLGDVCGWLGIRLNTYVSYRSGVNRWRGIRDSLQ